jgi:hypothetical protein
MSFLDSGGGGGKGGSPDVSGGGGGGGGGFDPSMGMGPDMTGLGGPGGDMAFGGPPGFGFPGGGNVTTPPAGDPTTDPNVGAPQSQAPPPGQSPTSIGGTQSGSQSPLEQLLSQTKGLRAQASPLEAAAAQGQGYGGGEPGTSTGLQETIPAGTATELQQQQAGGAERFAPAGAQQQFTQQQQQAAGQAQRFAPAGARPDTAAQQVAAGGAQRFPPAGARPDTEAQQTAAGQAQRYPPEGPPPAAQPPDEKIPPVEKPKTGDTSTAATTAAPPASTGPVSSRGQGPAAQGANPLQIIGDLLRGILTGDFSGLGQDLQGLSGQPGAQPGPGGYGPPGPTGTPRTGGPTSTGVAQPPAVGSQEMNSLPGAPEGPEPAADDAQGQRRKEWYQSHDRATPFPEDQFPEQQGPTGGKGSATPGQYGVLPGYGGQPQEGDQPIARGQVGANLMHGQYGAPGQNLTTVDAAGHRITVNSASAPHFQGFLNDLKAQGAPINSVGSYVMKNIQGTNNISQHSYGNAIDINQTSRNVTTGGFKQWADSHPQQFRAAMNKWGIISGGDWRNPDFGHFEWNGGGVGAGARTAGTQGAAATGGGTATGRGARWSNDPYTAQLINIESDGDPRNRTGSNYGLGQFSPDQFAHFGITNPYDPQQQIRAIAQERAENTPIARNILGRDPTAAELYLMHQQGQTGGANLLRAAQNNPNGPAWQTVGGEGRGDAFAIRKIRGNIPSDNPLRNVPANQVTNAQYVRMWNDRFNRGYQGGTAAQQPQAPQQPQAQRPQPARTRGQDLIGGPTMGSAADFLQDQGFGMTG